MNKKWYLYKTLWLFLIFTAYVLLGFLYVPKIITTQLKQQASSQLNMRFDVAKVEFNPLTFKTILSNFSLTDSADKQWFSASILRADFDPLNLLWGQWKVSELTLVKPSIDFITDPDGEVITPVLPKFHASQQADEPIDLVIADIEIDAGSLNLQAGNIKKDFSLDFNSIQIDHEKISFTDDDTRFDIKVTTPSNERIELTGHYNYVKQEINSQIKLNNWQATWLNQVLADEFLLETQQGLVQATGNISWQLQRQPIMRFEQITVTGFKSIWQQQLSVSELSAEITGVEVDTNKRSIFISQINSPQAQWDVMWPFEHIQSDTSESTETNEITDSWQITVQNFQVNQWPFTLQDHLLNQPLKVTLKQLNIKDFNNLGTEISSMAEMTFAGGGNLTFDSNQKLTPLQLKGQLQLTALNLIAIEPWITQQSGLVFTDGLLSTQQKFQLNSDEFELHGSLTLHQAKINNSAGQNIAEIETLQVADTSISSLNKTIVIDNITLDHANGNVITDSNQNFNLQNINQQGTSNSSTDPNQWIIQVGEVKLNENNTALTNTKQ